MNGKRLLGHGLLWAGFLVAVLATVSQKEFDLLPAKEQAILKDLNAGLTISKVEFQKLVDKPVAAQNDAELHLTVSQLNQWHEQQQAKLRAMKEAQLTPPPIVHPQNKSSIIAQRTAPLEHIWSTVHWLWYGLAMAVGVAGVMLLRSTARATMGSTQHVEGQFSTLENALRELNSRVGILYDRFDSLIPEEIVEYIDEQCVVYFNDFADSRNSLIQHFGLGAFGEIMSEFATAERYINRTWSASADGYLEEAQKCTARSLDHLRQAQRILEKWKGAN